jgi:hypothetical protein
MLTMSAVSVRHLSALLEQDAPQFHFISKRTVEWRNDLRSKIDKPHSFT